MVYVLCGGWDYEGEAVLGAYGSLEEAQAAGESVSADYDSVAVYEVVLGRDAALGLSAVWEG